MPVKIDLNLTPALFYRYISRVGEYKTETINERAVYIYLPPLEVVED
ncbi:hypothetical protein KEJ31_06315 [Candidatus Bathyarchaeota archaeon]|nr:hypothetical protein [Candidatus Bathyarchaeota archaeon]